MTVRRRKDFSKTEDKTEDAIIAMEGVEDEAKAYVDYMKRAQETKDPKLKATLEDVAKEELVHLGEFKQRADEAIGNVDEKIDEGEDEAEDESESKKKSVSHSGDYFDETVPIMKEDKTLSQHELKQKEGKDIDENYNGYTESKWDILAPDKKWEERYKSYTDPNFVIRTMARSPEYTEEFLREFSKNNPNAVAAFNKFDFEAPGPDDKDWQDAVLALDSAWKSYNSPKPSEDVSESIEPDSIEGAADMIISDNSDDFFKKFIQRAQTHTDYTTSNDVIQELKRKNKEAERAAKEAKRKEIVAQKTQRDELRRKRDIDAMVAIEKISDGHTRGQTRQLANTIDYNGSIAHKLMSEVKRVNEAIRANNEKADTPLRETQVFDRDWTMNDLRLFDEILKEALELGIDIDKIGYLDDDYIPSDRVNEIRNDKVAKARRRLGVNGIGMSDEDIIRNFADSQIMKDLALSAKPSFEEVNRYDVYGTPTARLISKIARAYFEEHGNYSPLEGISRSDMYIMNKMFPAYINAILDPDSLVDMMRNNKIDDVNGIESLLLDNSSKYFDDDLSYDKLISELSPGNRIRLIRGIIGGYGADRDLMLGEKEDPVLKALSEIEKYNTLKGYGGFNTIDAKGRRLAYRPNYSNFDLGGPGNKPLEKGRYASQIGLAEGDDLPQARTVQQQRNRDIHKKYGGGKGYIASNIGSFYRNVPESNIASPKGAFTQGFFAFGPGHGGLPTDVIDLRKDTSHDDIMRKTSRSIYPAKIDHLINIMGFAKALAGLRTKSQPVPGSFGSSNRVTESPRWSFGLTNDDGEKMVYGGDDYTDELGTTQLTGSIPSLIGRIATEQNMSEDDVEEAISDYINGKFDTDMVDSEVKDKRGIVSGTIRRNMSAEDILREKLDHSSTGELSKYAGTLVGYAKNIKDALSYTDAMDPTLLYKILGIDGVKDADGNMMATLDQIMAMPEGKEKDDMMKAISAQLPPTVNIYDIANKYYGSGIYSDRYKDIRDTAHEAVTRRRDDIRKILENHNVTFDNSGHILRNEIGKGGVPTGNMIPIIGAQTKMENGKEVTDKDKGIYISNIPFINKSKTGQFLNNNILNLLAQLYTSTNPALSKDGGSQSALRNSGNIPLFNLINNGFLDDLIDNYNAATENSPQMFSPELTGNTGDDGYALGQVLTDDEVNKMLESTLSSIVRDIQDGIYVGPNNYRHIIEEGVDKVMADKGYSVKDNSGEGWNMRGYDDIRNEVVNYLSHRDGFAKFKRFKGNFEKMEPEIYREAVKAGGDRSDFIELVTNLMRQYHDHLYGTDSRPAAQLVGAAGGQPAPTPIDEFKSKLEEYKGKKDKTSDDLKAIIDEMMSFIRFNGTEDDSNEASMIFDSGLFTDSDIYSNLATIASNISKRADDEKVGVQNKVSGIKTVHGLKNKEVAKTKDNGTHLKVDKVYSDLLSTKDDSGKSLLDRINELKIDKKTGKLKLKKGQDLRSIAMMLRPLIGKTGGDERYGTAYEMSDGIEEGDSDEVKEEKLSNFMRELLRDIRSREVRADEKGSLIEDIPENAMLNLADAKAAEQGDPTNLLSPTKTQYQRRLLTALNRLNALSDILTSVVSNNNTLAKTEYKNLGNVDYLNGRLEYLMNNELKNMNEATDDEKETYSADSAKQSDADKRSSLSHDGGEEVIGHTKDGRPIYSKPKLKDDDDNTSFGEDGRPYDLKNGPYSVWDQEFKYHLGDAYDRLNKIKAKIEAEVSGISNEWERKHKMNELMGKTLVPELYSLAKLFSDALTSGSIENPDMYEQRYIPNFSKYIDEFDTEGRLPYYILAHLINNISDRDAATSLSVDDLDQIMYNITTDGRRMKDGRPTKFKHVRRSTKPITKSKKQKDGEPLDLLSNKQLSRLGNALMTGKTVDGMPLNVDYSESNVNSDLIGDQFTTEPIDIKSYIEQQFAKPLADPRPRLLYNDVQPNTYRKMLNDDTNEVIEQRKEQMKVNNKDMLDTLDGYEPFTTALYDMVPMVNHRIFENTSGERPFDAAIVSNFRDKGTISDGSNGNITSIIDNKSPKQEEDTIDDTIFNDDDREYMKYMPIFLDNIKRDLEKQIQSGLYGDLDVNHVFEHNIGKYNDNGKIGIQNNSIKLAEDKAKNYAMRLKDPAVRQYVEAIKQAVGEEEFNTNIDIYLNDALVRAEKDRIDTKNKNAKDTLIMYNPELYDQTLTNEEENRLAEERAIEQQIADFMSSIPDMAPSIVKDSDKNIIRTQVGDHIDKAYKRYYEEYLNKYLRSLGDISKIKNNSILSKGIIERARKYAKENTEEYLKHSFIQRKGVPGKESISSFRPPRQRLY